MALFSSAAHPAYCAQRSERVKHRSFLGRHPNNLSCFWKQRDGGVPRWKSQIVKTNATNLFSSKVNFPIYWIEWLWRWIYLSFSFYLFWTLNWGALRLFYTPQYQYLKAVPLLFCPRILNVSQYFIQKLPCPSNCQSVGFLFFLSFEEMLILLLIKSKQCL